MQPYAYTGDDPLNATDPLGLKGGGGNLAALECRGLKGHRLSSCDTKYHKVQCHCSGKGFSLLKFAKKHWRGEVQIIGAAAAVTAIVATGGAAAIGEGGLATALDATATVSSYAAAATDAPGCFGGHDAASCVGFATGGLTGGLGTISRYATLAPSATDALTQFKVLGAGTLGLWGFLADRAGEATGT
jgi:hypothetical protein